MNVALLFLILYFVVMAGIGVWTTRRSSTSTEDYLLAGRSLGPAVTALRLQSSSMSGYMFLGAGSLGYTQGYFGMWYALGDLGGGYLPQEASIFRKMTVEQNIRAILEISTKDKNRIDSEVERLLSDLNIERLRHNPAPSLSGGERRRVEIARVLAMQPRFILLDEPFAGVDPIAVIDIQKIIEFLKSRGIGVLITDHNVRETLSICDRAYIISDGAVLAAGKPDELVNNEQVRSVYLGENFKY